MRIFVLIWLGFNTQFWAVEGVLLEDPFEAKKDGEIRKFAPGVYMTLADFQEHIKKDVKDQEDLARTKNKVYWLEEKIKVLEERRAVRDELWEERTDLINERKELQSQRGELLKERVALEKERTGVYAREARRQRRKSTFLRIQGIGLALLGFRLGQMIP
tara:strand:+ start:606 stop:1085 length:480 start_codon:yes stop_codon:yes gene_type:complete